MVCLLHFFPPIYLIILPKKINHYNLKIYWGRSGLWRQNVSWKKSAQLTVGNPALEVTRAAWLVDVQQKVKIDLKKKKKFKSTARSVTKLVLQIMFI